MYKQLSKSSEKSKILVTGATGWVGKSFLEELLKHIPSEEYKERVYAFASKKCRVKIKGDNGIEINVPVQELSKIIKHRHSEKILLIHAAFLTKDKMAKYGERRFAETNSAITNIITSFVDSCKQIKVVHISSGAAKVAKSGINELAETNNIYGFQK